MARELLSPLSDDVFKYIFADQRNIDNLAALLRPILNLPETEYSRLTLVDPFLRRLFRRDKQGILDVRVHTTSGRVINIEVQVCQSAVIRKRILYYLSKLLWWQINRGDRYEKIQQVIGVIICDHVIADEEGKPGGGYPSRVSLPGLEAEDRGRYLNSYSFRSDHSGKYFTDLLKIVTLELPKVPEEPDGSAIWPWARFFKCHGEEEFSMLAKQYPETKKAVGTLKKMSLGKQIRMILEEREIYRMDVQAITDYAKQKAQEEGRAKGLEEGQAKGLEEGLAKGLEEGLAKGLEEGQAKGLEEGLAKGLTEGLEKGRAEGLAAAYREKLDTARSLKAEGFPLEIIARSLKLPLEEVEGL